MEKYRYCASCIHFGIIRQEKNISFQCNRLGYNTDPKYQFHCWTPKERVKRKIQIEGEGKE